MALPILDDEELFLYTQLEEIYGPGVSEEPELEITLPEKWSKGDEIPVTDIRIKEEVSETELKSELEPFKTVTAPFKKYIRSSKKTFTGEEVSLTKIRNNYIIGHLTNADLSILNDFNDYKEYLDIVNNSIVTLKNPIPLAGVNVYIRDTMLLAPGG